MSAIIGDNHLYLQYEFYDVPVGYRTEEKIIPLSRINFVQAKFGVRGGFHGFTIRSKEIWFGDTFKPLAEFGRDMRLLYNQTKQILEPRGFEFREVKE